MIGLDDEQIAGVATVDGPGNDANDALELTDGQVKVCIALRDAEDGRMHVYGIQKVLMQKYPDDKPYPERSISNLLNRLITLGLVHKEDRLQPNPVGPARQMYRLVDLNRANDIIRIEGDRRIRYINETGLGVAAEANATMSAV